MFRVVAALVSGIALAGCAREEEHRLPSACRLGPDAVRSALAAAPGEVRLEGGTALSDCLVRTSEQADVLLVGEIYLAVASELADGAQAAPSGPGPLRLGYLMGAVRRGAGGTQGIHDELVRRLEQELGRIPAGGGPALRRGERAGRESG